MNKSNEQDTSSITAVILTKDEELHIARCINSLKAVCSEVWVVDSYSGDDTMKIATELGAKTVQHKFENQAQQFNWAIDNLEINSEWIWRIDADEYVTSGDAAKIVNAINNCDGDVNGIYLNRAIVFHGRKLKHGGWYPAPQIKIIRKGFGRSENKVMDEHLIISSGKTISVDADQIDENMNSLSWWTGKHNGYSSREAFNMLLMQYGLDDETEMIAPRFWGTDAERKRWLKTRYVHLPLLVRPFLYFFTRYFLMLGFLDGRWGFVWHVLQGFWYRFLVDAKILEIKQKFGFNDKLIIAYLKSNRKTSI